MSSLRVQKKNLTLSEQMAAMDLNAATSQKMNIKSHYLASNTSLLYLPYIYTCSDKVRTGKKNTIYRMWIYIQHHHCVHFNFILVNFNITVIISNGRICYIFHFAAVLCHACHCCAFLQLYLNNYTVVLHLIRVHVCTSMLCLSLRSS